VETLTYLKQSGIRMSNIVLRVTPKKLSGQKQRE
jgi:hypothetical protein